MACRQLYMIAAALLILPSCRARVLTVEWTDEGVAMYSCSGLHVELEDIAIFQCTNGSFSNIIYQPDRAQFDACNTSASAGEAIPFAECRGSERNITLTVDTRSGDLNSAIPISAGESLYFTSYSTGTSQSATTDRTHGGECLMGLKLAIHIAGGNSPPSSGTLDADGNCVAGVQPGGSSSNTAIIPIIAGASVGGAVLIGVPLITLCVCTRKSKKKRERFIGVSNGCENGTVVTVKTATLQMNGSGGAPDATRTEVAVSVVVEGNGDKPGPPPLPLPTPAKPQQKIAASNGSAPQPDNSSPRTGGKKNDPSGVQAAGGHRAKPRPNRVAPSNPRGDSKSTAATGAPSGKNASAQPGSVSQRDRAPGSKVSSDTAAKPSPPPAFVQSGVLKSAKPAINANKKADNTDRVTRSLTSNSAPVNDKTDTPVTASLGPQDNPQGRGKATRNVSTPVPSHETVTVASSSAPPKPSTTTVMAASSKDPPKPPKPSTTTMTAASSKNPPKPSTTTVTAASSKGPPKPPKPSTTTVTAASSKDPPKPSTTQGSKPKQEAAAVTDREPSSAERRHTDSNAPPEPAQRRPAPPPPPGAQQRLPPLQRCFTDAGQQSREQQAPLTAKLIASK